MFSSSSDVETWVVRFGGGEGWDTAGEAAWGIRISRMPKRVGEGKEGEAEEEEECFLEDECVFSVGFNSFFVESVDEPIEVMLCRNAEKRMDFKNSFDLIFHQFLHFDLQIHYASQT